MGWFVLKVLTGVFLSFWISYGVLLSKPSNFWYARCKCVFWVDSRYEGRAEDQQVSFHCWSHCWGDSWCFRSREQFSNVLTMGEVLGLLSLLKRWGKWLCYQTHLDAFRGTKEVAGLICYLFQALIKKKSHIYYFNINITEKKSFLSRVFLWPFEETARASCSICIVVIVTECSAASLLLFSLN